MKLLSALLTYLFFISAWEAHFASWENDLYLLFFHYDLNESTIGYSLECNSEFRWKKYQY